MAIPHQPSALTRQRFTPKVDKQPSPCPGQKIVPVVPFPPWHHPPGMGQMDPACPGAELAPPAPVLLHSPPVPLQAPPGKTEFQMMEGTLERKHVLQTGGRKVRAWLRGSFGTGVLGHGGRPRFQGKSEARDAPGATVAVLLTVLGGQSPLGLGDILSCRGLLVFSQTHWYHSCPLLASRRPTAAPGASSTPC